MLFDIFPSFSRELRAFHKEIPFQLSCPVDVVLILIALLLLWRVWRFTLMPYWWPDEPKEIPYWIPSRTLTSAFVSWCPDLISVRYESDGDR